MRKQSYKHRHIVNAIISKLSTLPENTEVSTSQIVEMLYGKCNFTELGYDYGAVLITNDEYFDLHNQVITQAKKQGLILDSSPWIGIPMGLPFHCPYFVKHARNDSMI